MKSYLLAATLLCAGPVFAHDDHGRGDIEHVNSGITIDDRETAGDLSTVNGGIHIGAGAEVGSAETVNGGIKMGADSHARSIETVNGGLSLGRNARVDQDAETVNGGVSLESGAYISGRLENVNGEIELDHARIGGGIKTVNGDVTIGDGSVVDVGLKVDKPNMNGWFNWSKPRTPRIVIGANAVVNGPLVFERDVELYVHDSAKIGAVTGATPKRYSGAHPPL